MIINLGCASVDNHIPRDDIFDYHPRRECNIYIISSQEKESIISIQRAYSLHVYEVLISHFHLAAQVRAMSLFWCNREQQLLIKHLFY